MFSPRSLKIAIVVITAAILAAGSLWATENKRNENQTIAQSPTGPAKESSVKMDFVRIPAGSFYMGSPSSEKDREDDEGPVHEVRITKPFYMGKYEVTQAQWKAVMGTTLLQQRDKAWRLKGEGPEHPIYYVSWEDAEKFCKKLGSKFRLPTEAEWEYACRAGSQTRFYYGDDPNESELDQYAWYYGESDNRTHPVGQKKPNAWGLYDMHGNVDEWCSDQYLFPDINNKISDSEGKFLWRVVRGGNWIEKPKICRSANRRGLLAGSKIDFIGFRVVYTGRGGGREVMEVALPHKVLAVASTSDKEPETQPQTIVGVVRDEAGLPVDDVKMRILPFQALRQYAEGQFEIGRFPSDPNTRSQIYHFMARQEQRNLAVCVEIVEDANELDIKLKPGAILSGKVVDTDRKQIEGAKVATRLQGSGWHTFISPLVVETDAEGKFEIRALPSGYDYVLSARKMHYLIGRTEVHSEDIRDNGIVDVSIVLPRGKFSVSGVVVDANGKPVPNVWVYCAGKGQAGINSHTDAEGHFKADGIFEGQVNIIASIKGNDGGWLGGNVSVQAGASDVRIVLNRNATPPPKGRVCFPAETDVWVNGVVVLISEVALGKTIGEHGCSAPTTAFGQIEDIEEHSGKFMFRDIMLENGNHISVVDSHCFMLDSGRWIAAQDLRAGLRLKTLDGTVGIKSVTMRATPYVGKVYNLKIANSDRYPVGKDGVIVRDY